MRLSGVLSRSRLTSFEHRRLTAVQDSAATSLAQPHLPSSLPFDQLRPGSASSRQKPNESVVPAQAGTQCLCFADKALHLGRHNLTRYRHSSSLRRSAIRYKCMPHAAPQETVVPAQAGTQCLYFADKALHVCARNLTSHRHSSSLRISAIRYKCMPHAAAQETVVPAQAGTQYLCFADKALHLCLHNHS